MLKSRSSMMINFAMISSYKTCMSRRRLVLRAINHLQLYSKLQVITHILTSTKMMICRQDSTSAMTMRMLTRQSMQRYMLFKAREHPGYLEIRMSPEPPTENPFLTQQDERQQGVQLTEEQEKVQAPPLLQVPMCLHLIPQRMIQLPTKYCCHL